MYQLQNFVQPGPERDLARGALSLKEIQRQEGCGAALGVGKGGGGFGPGTSRTQAAGCCYLAKFYPGQQGILHLAALSCGPESQTEGGHSQAEASG